MKLSSLNIFKNNDQIALVGSGGKTSILFGIAKELFSDNCFVTTTTKMWIRESKYADHAFKIDRVDSIDMGFGKGINFVYKRIDSLEPEKVNGFEEDQLKVLSKKLKELNIPLLIEADGSKQKPIKFPASHEPVIPKFINKVCLIVGLSAIGQNLSSNNFHRPELISAAINLPLGSEFSWEHLYQLLINENGWIKDIPPESKKILFLHQADVLTNYDDVNKLAIKLLNHYDHILLSSMRNGGIEIVAHWGQIGCGILAAGSSTRFGSPKQLAVFNKKTFIENVIQTALRINFSEVITVLGSSYEKIRPVVENYPVKIIHNKAWEEGQSTSVKECVKYFLPKNVEAIVFLMVDQPQIGLELLENIIHTFAYHKNDIIVHTFNLQNRHPILFSRSTFRDLLRIVGEEGGRQLFEKYPPKKILIHDSYYSYDVDKIEDLKKIEKR